MGAPDFVGALASFGDRPALVTAAETITYRDLSARVAERLQDFGGGPELIAITARNTPGTVISYLAALKGGHTVLMLPPCRSGDLVAAYDPDVLVDGERTTMRRRESAHRLHPDLRILLSTSGSTGSPKLVRLSHRNLSSNAAAVADSLGLTRDDRGITTLSMSYSYGLSVVNSHLAAGASLVLTDASVTDPDFRYHAAGVTTMAAVPYSFELFDRSGLPDLPSLRLLTCAGGRLAPGIARRYAAIGARRGWQLILMYGQTEATARMACQPGHLTAQYPDCVGTAVPGGTFRIADPDAAGVGEIVYSGPNVMMGYARTPADLACGPTITELRTGDRGRFTDEGLVQIVGRQSDFAKVMGLRIDIGHVDQTLAQSGIRAAAVAMPDRLGIVACDADVIAVREVVVGATGLPPAVIDVVALPDLPRLDSGKIDRAAVQDALGRRPAEPEVGPTDPAGRLAARYSDLLGRPVQRDDSFASLGGDSMSYVAVSIAVEQVLGELPDRWHESTITELAGHAHRPSPVRTLHQVEFSVVLRAAAILVVVGSHAGVVDLRGGAHLLMALVGFNVARFQLSDTDRRRRLRRMIRGSAEILVPALVCVGALVALTPVYTWRALGVNAIASPTTDTPDWRYWFIEALVWLLPLTAALVHVPAIDALRNRHRFGVPVALTLIALAAFHLFVPDARPTVLFSPWAVGWIFFLGWAAAEAATDRQRAFLSVIVVALVPWSFDGMRMVTVPAGLLLLVWVSRVRLPMVAAAGAAALAEASLFVFLLHWPVLEVIQGWQAVVVSVVVGLGAFRMYRRVRAQGLRNRLATALPSGPPARPAVVAPA